MKRNVWRVSVLEVAMVDGDQVEIFTTGCGSSGSEVETIKERPRLLTSVKRKEAKFDFGPIP